MPEKYFKPNRRFNFLNLLLLILFALIIIKSGQATDFDLLAFTDQRNLAGMGRFINGLWPMELSSEFLKDIGKLIVETIEISMVGTMLGVVLAIPLTFAATRIRGEEFTRRNRGTLPWLVGWSGYHLSRLLLNLFRGIPEILWALIFVVAVGLGPFPGVLALAVHSCGILGKLYSEILESVDQRLVETVRSTGAGELAVLIFARIPVSLPVLVSYTLFRWECNMRAATVLGLVGAGGIGTQLMISMQLFAYNEVSTLVAAILLLVVIVDLVGQFVRTRILDSPVNCSTQEKFLIDQD